MKKKSRKGAEVAREDEISLPVEVWTSIIQRIALTNSSSPPTSFDDSSSPYTSLAGLLDLARISRTCSSFRDIARLPTFWRSISFQAENTGTRKLVAKPLSICKLLRFNFVNQPLRRLCLASTDINDEVLIYIATRCRGLEELDIGECHNLSSRPLLALRACCSHLQKLRLGYTCNGMTRFEPFLLLLQAMPNLVLEFDGPQIMPRVNAPDAVKNSNSVIRSPQIRVPNTEITFINRCDKPVSVRWLDWSGTEVGYNVLSSGASYSQQTFVSHVWAMVCDNAPCMYTVGMPWPQVVIITDPKPDSKNLPVPVPGVWRSINEAGTATVEVSTSSPDDLLLLAVDTEGNEILPSDGVRKSRIVRRGKTVRLSTHPGEMWISRRISDDKVVWRYIQVQYGAAPKVKIDVHPAHNVVSGDASSSNRQLRTMDEEVMWTLGNTQVSEAEIEYWNAIADGHLPQDTAQAEASEAKEANDKDKCSCM